MKIKLFDIKNCLLALPQSLLTVALILILPLSTLSGIPFTKSVSYKEVTQTNLKLFIWENSQGDSVKPAILFIHGGGWNNGNPLSAEKLFSDYFLNEGFVCASVGYRCREWQNSTVADATKDVRSAYLAFLKLAPELHFDPKHVIVAGSSAGGHLACMVASGEGLGEPEEDKWERPLPMALLLFNPVSDTTDDGYGGSKRFGSTQECLRFSPRQLLKVGSSPTFLVHGDADKTVPYKNALSYAARLKELGIPYEFMTIEGGGHALMATKEFPKIMETAITFLKQQDLYH